MAATDLSTPEIVSVGSLLGIHANGTFVRHVGLLRLGDEQQPAISLEAGDTVAMYHMSPPPGVTPFRVQVAAWLEDLRRDEAQLIEMEAEHLVTLGGQYLVYPSTDVKRDPVTNMIQRYRCSCVGFVMLCYASARIRLLDETPANMPAVDFAIVDEVYQISQYRGRFMARFGLKGSGPWPLILPGYVFHSLRRPSAVVRNQPYAPPGAHESRFPY